MFQNMTQREKILTATFGSLLPLILLFWGWNSFYQSYRKGQHSIQALQAQIDVETKKKIDAMLAGTRRAYFYKPRSLSTHQRHVTQYQDWLERLIRDCGMGYQTIDRPRESELAYMEGGQGVSSIGKERLFNFDATGTLDQILKFCNEFERLEVLHKIKELTLTPIKDKNSNTGKFKAIFAVQVLSLNEADDESDFLSRKQDRGPDLEDFDIILARNIFGPANNAPRLTVSRQTFEEGKEISVALIGRDDDKNDQLTYEIIDSGSVKEALIEQDQDSNRGKLVAPAQEIGEYLVTVRVKDSGFPPKSSDTEFKIVVKEKPEPVVTKEPAPPPPFRNATETQINRISSRNGVYEAKIRVRTTGQVFVLQVGDEFELDDAIWQVINIGRHTLSLESNGKLMEFRQGDFLGQPRTETLVKQSDVVETSVDKS